VNLSEEINKCLVVLNKGGIMLYPTDTIWGIGCDATNIEAINKIYDVKKRPDKRALIILLPDQNLIYNYVKAPHKSIFEYLEHAEKPTTVIYNNAINLPKELLGENNSIAIRIVKDAFCKQLLMQLKKPLVSTSANISGSPSPQNYMQITNEIKRGVDHIVNYRRDDVSLSVPSSIIKLNDDGSISTLRS
jgi:L-threonylcarbamoyladenylate synthase